MCGLTVFAASCPSTAVPVKRSGSSGRSCVSTASSLLLRAAGLLPRASGRCPEGLATALKAKCLTRFNRAFLPWFVQYNKEFLKSWVFSQYHQEWQNPQRRDESWTRSSLTFFPSRLYLWLQFLPHACIALLVILGLSLRLSSLYPQPQLMLNKRSLCRRQ